MTSEVSSGDVGAASGARYRTGYLIQQANATLAAAQAEGPALAALLPPKTLEDVAKLRDEVDKMRGDKAVSEAESKQATLNERDHLREMKIWQRKPARRCLRAHRIGVAVPDELLYVGHGQTVPAVLDQASRTIALLTEYATVLDAVGPPTQPLIEEGKKAYQALEEADKAQQQARTSQLPAAVRAFFAKKTQLYLLLKTINDAGHELYASDPTSAAKFNLSILYRRRLAGGEAGGGTPPEPPPVAPRLG